PRSLLWVTFGLLTTVNNRRFNLYFEAQPRERPVGANRHPGSTISFAGAVMATVPIEIFQLDASGEARYKVTSGRIEGQLKAALDITAEACHGIALGIEPGIFGELSAQGQALLVGGSAQGQLAARAGA